MSEKIVIGPINKGLKTDRLPFNIDNDSFPTLINAYQWRGRVKRKRGTELLGRLKLYFDSTSTAYNSGSTTFALVAGAGNILTGFSLQTNGNIIPGMVTINDTTVAQAYTDAAMDGTLSGSLGGTGTINYATGAITISGGGVHSVNAMFFYYPTLPVMGLEDLLITSSQFPQTLGFDSSYSYSISINSPFDIFDVSFYKNLPSGTYIGYTQKTTWSPTIWNGQNYQQFWTINYQGALWESNGIQVPFDSSKVGMQFKPIVTATIHTAGPPAEVDLNIVGHGLVIGDFVFINEVQTTTGINFQTGYVGVIVDVDTVRVTLPNATIAMNGTGGIAQYLTSMADPTKDCLRWYDGAPVNGANPPAFSTGSGWVNFMPPLSEAPYSVAENLEAQYYLVGARLIFPFKDRLLFLGAVIQSSSGSPIYLQDTIVYSQNGTPYYTASFTGDPLSATTTFNPILVPTNQTATPTSYWEDQDGFGGFTSAGVSQQIISASSNEDVLIIGFSNNLQTRLVYSGNDIAPFNFFAVNSELGSSSTFSAVNLDRGVLTIGEQGLIMTTQISSQRVDLDIPDQIFQLNLQGNGSQRVCAQRDFINEWIYFTYRSNQTTAVFPNQTMQYNYRENTWSLNNECYTTYGTFRKATGFTWATVGNTFPTWASWNEPWNAGSSTLLQPYVIGGNQQGFVLIRDQGTNEGNSLYIQSFSGSVITSPDHCLNNGDFITISGCLGTVGSQVNGKIFKVGQVMQNTFSIEPEISSGTYLGSGLIKRMYIPNIQTKQFPVSWSMGRKTRIGVQQYLLTTTDDAQITLLIFLSENSANAYNEGGIVPANNTVNSSLIYSTVLFTAPESTNLGLTAPNTNLQMPTALQQQQIWHRINTSLIGDTVQLGFTLSDEQMRTVDNDGNPISQFAEIELHGAIIDVHPSSLLS